ncbi:DUF58 domain-containing protein [Georgenia satyanarayanai]|uniref:DUF58 domain-containing protein n=1 Tax=Georgenia satyanarayanai TaxID=860221 RepID=UPI0012651DE5|nr:DUF58 domain-containing protein [Georgenia satyanarayanai]
MSEPSTTTRGRAALSGRLAETSALRSLVDRTRAPRLGIGRAAKAVSVAGWAVLAVGLLAWVAGRRLGWVELVVLGATLVTTFVAALVFTLGRHPYEVSLRLSDRRVVVGERAMAGVTVRNAAAHPVLPARVELPVGAAEVGFHLPGLGAGEDHEEIFAIPTSRRSVIQVGPVRTVRGDPLGLMRRGVAWGDPQELYVHPRTVVLSSSAAGFIHDLEGKPTRDVTSADLSFHALREYVPGDDRRYVHWRTSARAGKLMVRQFEETRRSHLVVGMSRNERDYAEDEEFETAVSTLGSLALQAMREEKDLTTLTSHETLRAVSAGQYLDALTRVERDGGPTGVLSIAHQISREVERASMVVLVCGSTVTPEQIRAAGAVLPVDARAFAVQVVAGAETAVHTVGVVTVLTIGELSELRRGFRKAERR